MRPYRELWYRYVAPCTGALAISADKAASTFLQVTTPGCTAGSTCDSSEQLSLTSLYSSSSDSIDVELGTTILIRAGADSPRALPVISGFNVSCVSTIPQNAITGARVITGTGVFEYDTTQGSSDYCQNDVWFLWTASCTGRAYVTGCETYNSTSTVQPIVAILTATRSSILLHCIISPS